MKILSLILSGLQAAVAAKAARDRTLTVLLVAVWGRIARMRTRLERLIALWRAGTLPQPRVAVARPGRARAVRQVYPTGRAWLAVRVRDAVPFGTQLQHLLSEAEWTAFLTAVPQAARIVRPLFHMLGVDEIPEAVRKRPRPVYAVAPAPGATGGHKVDVPGRFFSET